MISRRPRLSLGTLPEDARSIVTCIVRGNKTGRSCESGNQRAYACRRPVGRRACPSPMITHRWLEAKRDSKNAETPGSPCGHLCCPRGDLPCASREEESFGQHEGLTHVGGEGHRHMGEGTRRRQPFRPCSEPALLPQTWRHPFWDVLSQAYGAMSSKAPVEHGCRPAPYVRSGRVAGTQSQACIGRTSRRDAVWNQTSAGWRLAGFYIRPWCSDLQWQTGQLTGGVRANSPQFQPSERGIQVRIFERTCRAGATNYEITDPASARWR